MQIDWKPDHIATETLDFDEILLSVFGKLDLPGTGGLKPLSQVYSLGERNLRQGRMAGNDYQKQYGYPKRSHIPTGAKLKAIDRKTVAW